MIENADVQAKKAELAARFAKFIDEMVETHEPGAEYNARFGEFYGEAHQELMATYQASISSFVQDKLQSTPGMDPADRLDQMSATLGVVLGLQINSMASTGVEEVVGTMTSTEGRMAGLQQAGKNDAQ